MSSPATAEMIPAQFDDGPSRATRSRSRAQLCRFCSRPNSGDVVDAGGDVGKVHRACFVEWDRRQEALEGAAMVALSLPDPREVWSELELEDPVARAA